jgi:hypothetical protein
MKHLKKFYESIDTEEEEILENFISITDRFGNPVIYASSFGKNNKWTITWNISLDLSVLQEANQLVKKLKDITEDIDDVLAASDRLGKYNVNMSLTNKLKIELVPKDTGDDNFEFIAGYESRSLYVRINEVERFFNSRGLRVVKWDLDSSYNEYNETNDLEIFLNKGDNQVTSEFHNLVMAELNLIDDREYVVRMEGNTKVVIYPTEEKSYVEVTNGRGE